MHKTIPTLALAALLPGLAAAANGVYTTETSFVGAAGPSAIEGFESVAPTLRGLAPVVAPLLTVTTVTTPIGINDGPSSPQDGFGALATEGTHYLTVYAPNVPQGTIRFDLQGPTTAFGFHLTDAGETAGTVTLRTDTGFYATGIELANYTTLLGNGNVQFFGITQTLAFTQVFLTVTGVDEAYGVDKIYIGLVPEPAPAALLFAGLGVLACTRRRPAPR